MDRRKALKNVAFYSELPSPPLQLVLFESFTLPEDEKNQCFFQEQMKRFCLAADIIIPTTKLSQELLVCFISIMIKDCYPAAMQHAFVRLKRNGVKSNTRLQ
jgi:hypothetical protein